MIICLFFLTAGDKGKKVNYQKKKSMKNDLLTAWHGPSAVLALNGVHYYYFFVGEQAQTSLGQISNEASYDVYSFKAVKTLNVLKIIL